MDLIPTQDIDEIPPPADENIDDVRPWGRLLPLKNKFPSVELISESYVFGRADDCDLVFTLAIIGDLTQFSTLSKKHFRIFLESGNQGKLVFIEDLSSNGTFVNGIKIGRGKTQPLNNNDEVSLSFSHFKCFIFSDSNCIQDAYPTAVTTRFTVSKLIGRGACGEVMLVFEKGSCKKRAMKIVHKKTFSLSPKFDKDISDRIKSEVDILMRLKHPCTIRIYDVVDTDEAIYMILELVEGGELFDRIVGLGQIPEQDAKFLFFQVVTAVKYLHEHGITHRDLKPENILLANSGNRCLVKVTDFGLSKFVDGNTMLRTFCGTPTYLAPEVLLTAGSGTYTSAIDVWSLGVILYVCLVGYPPFTDERKDHDLQAQITQGLYEFPDPYWKGISEEAKSLIRKLLTVDPSKRVSIQAVLDDPWFDDASLKQEVWTLLTNSAVDEASMDSTDSAEHTVSMQPVTDGLFSPHTAPEHGHDQPFLRDKPIIRKRPPATDDFIPQKQFIY